MNDKQIRREVRLMIREAMHNHAAYYVNSVGNYFPQEEEDGGIVKLAQDIDTRGDYLINWDGMSENQDLYHFPLEEFKKGIEVERAKNNLFNILDIAKKVINNLEQDTQFYSNLGI